MQSVQQYSYAINQWFTTTFEKTPPNVITTPLQKNTTNTGTKILTDIFNSKVPNSNLFLYQDYWRHLGSCECFNSSIVSLVFLGCNKLMSEQCLSLATKMSENTSSYSFMAIFLPYPLGPTWLNAIQFRSFPTRATRTARGTKNIRPRFQACSVKLNMFIQVC